jgi:hypothetical protein
LWVVVVVAATLVTLVSGGIAIFQFLTRDGGPAAFADDLHTAAGAESFLEFARENDGDVVRLDTRCLYRDGPRTCLDRRDPLERAAVLLDLNADRGCPPDQDQPCPGSVVLAFFVDDVSQAQVDNGEYGAGSVVVHGYFAVSVRGRLGTLPPGVTAIYLTAVPAEQARR